MRKISLFVFAVCMVASSAFAATLDKQQYTCAVNGKKVVLYAMSRDAAKSEAAMVLKGDASKVFCSASNTQFIDP